MKKVLIVTYYWPPSGRATVHWPLAVAKYLPKFGWEPIVATVDEDTFSEKDYSLLSEVENISAIKSKANDPFNFYRKFIGKNKGETISASEAISLETQSIKHKIAIWIRMNLFVPDARVGWYFSAKKSISDYLEKNKVDRIITIGPPHSSHLIGMNISKKFNIPHIPVLIDPWVDIIYYKNFKRSKLTLLLDNYFEKSVLENSAHTAFVTETTKANYLNKYKLLKNKSSVLRWGYNEKDFNAQSVENKNYKLILHAGNIFDYQNPKYFWKNIAEERKKGNDLRLRFIGTVSPLIKTEIENAGLSNVTEYVGFLPFAKVHEEMLNADFLLVCASEPRHVPGKLYEYLRANKPIIGFGDNNNEVENMITEASSGMLFPYNYQKMDIFDLLKNVNPNKEIIFKYERFEITKALCAILENLK